MRAADRSTIEELGVPGFTLMETAARGALDAIEGLAGPSDEISVLVLAGHGNNGGDGLAVARMLAIRGARVLVLTTATAHNATADGAANLALLERLEDDELCWIDLEFVPEDVDRAALGERVAAWASSGSDRALVCVDALLGIGASGPLRAPLDALAEVCAAFEMVVSLDVPSGLDSDTGLACDERAVAATMTVAMGALKPGLLLGDGPDFAGELQLVEIGIPPTLLASGAASDGSAWMLGSDSVDALLPMRERGAHKFSVGQVALVAGSDSYPGAAVLASSAAARVGAGYVLTFTCEAARAALHGRLPEACVQVRPGSPDRAASAMATAGSRAAGWVVGPGLAADESSNAMVRALLERLDGPAVIDAGGLTALFPWIHDGSMARRAAGRWILTPHPGELGQLLDAAAADEDMPHPIQRARTLAARWNCVLVLKGSPTLVCDPGGSVFIASDAPTSLATAGSGDVLAGTIGGLLAQGLDPLDAALAGVHVGLRAARHAEAHRESEFPVASDLIDSLPAALRGAPTG